MDLDQDALLTREPHRKTIGELFVRDQSTQQLRHDFNRLWQSQTEQACKMKPFLIFQSPCLHGAPYSGEDHARRTDVVTGFRFEKPGAVAALSSALLKSAYDLDVQFPVDRLTPTVTLRVNYIHWLEDLLQPLEVASSEVTGLDVGTGAACIYPLLGCRIAGWNFLATDIDQASLAAAQTNVERNALSQRITLRQVDAHAAPLSAALQDFSASVQFCMCNPPFHDSADGDAVERMLGVVDQRPRNLARPTGCYTELATAGGEVAFVTRIVEDSFALQGRIMWYTSMFGKKSSAKQIYSMLKDRGCRSVCTTEFFQGDNVRWGVAWTFSSSCYERLPKLLQISLEQRKRKRKALQNNTADNSCFIDITGLSSDSVVSLVAAIFSDLQVNVIAGSLNQLVFTARVHKNLWVHGRKRRRQQQLLQDRPDATADCPLVSSGLFDVNFELRDSSLRLHLIEGGDKEQFLSFHQHLARMFSLEKRS